MKKSACKEKYSSPFSMRSSDLDDIGNLIRKLYVRRRLVFWIFLVMSLVSLVVTLAVGKRYTLSGEVILLSTEIYNKGQNVIEGATGNRYLPVSLKDIETEATILRSVPLLRKTVQGLYDEGKLILEQSWLDRWLKQPLRHYIIQPVKNFFGNEEEQGNPVEDLVLLVLDGLQILPLPGSNVISVTYESKNIEQGRLIVNRLIDDYLWMRSELYAGNAENMFGRKKGVYKERLDTLFKKKMALLGEYESRKPEEELSIILQSINIAGRDHDDLSEQVLEVSKWQKYFEENIRQLRGTRATEVSIVSDAEFARAGDSQLGSRKDLMQQIDQIRSLQNEYDKALVSFTENSQPVLQTIDKLELAKKRLLALFQKYNQNQLQKIRVLQSVAKHKEERLSSLKQRAVYLSQLLVLLAEIETELKVANEAYYRYSQLYEEKHLENMFSQDNWKNVKVLSYAPQPLGPSSPKKKLVFLIGIFSSFVTAISVALLYDFLDRFRLESWRIALTGEEPMSIDDRAQGYVEYKF